MIRREIHLPEQPPQWLLISQVEHARLSGVLAEHCLKRLGEVTGVAAEELGQVREELLQAVIHHDDGWARWEQRPGLDKQGRPLSFTELPHSQSLVIWTDSIESAAQLGPLAGWTVAGHFLALLTMGEEGEKDLAEQQWQKEMQARRLQWLEQWQSADAARHSRELAEECWLWLRLLDVMSLWLCSACPAQNECPDALPSPYVAGEGETLETEFRCLPSTATAGRSNWVPWRLNVPELRLEAKGWLVPKKRYDSPEQLLVARKDYSLCWNLTASP